MANLSLYADDEIIELSNFITLMIDDNLHKAKKLINILLFEYYNHLFCFPIVDFFYVQVLI